MIRVTALYMVLIALSSCASTKTTPAVVQNPDDALTGARIGVAHLRGQADVVVAAASLEHILYPPAPHPSRASSKSLACKTFSSRVQDDQEAWQSEDQDSSHSVSDADADVWHKLCEGLSPMSLDDWRVIETSDVPIDLAATWDTHCAASR
jgi:hypothetical protein